MPAKHRHQLKPERLVLIALVAVIGYFAWDKWQTQSRLSSPEYLVELANGLQQDSDTGRHAQMILETRALAKEEFLRLQSVIDSSEQQLRSLKSDAARLDALLEQIRTTNKGSAIAADRESLTQFHAAASGYSLTPEMLVSYQQTLDALREPIEAAIAQGKFDKPPATDLGARLRTLRDDLTRDAALVKTTEQQVEAVLASAPPAGQGAATNLSVALVALEAEWEAANMQAAAVEAVKVREQYREKFAAQQAQQERELLEAKLQNEQQVYLEKMNAERLAAEREARRIADAAEEAKLAEVRRETDREQRMQAEAAEREYQQALPEIESYLAGFITPGQQQLVRGRWVYTVDPKPFSLSELKARRCLEESDTGYMQLGTYAGADKNDRPAGALAGYNGVGHVPPAMVADIAKAQSLLKKFGDQLVEKGKLLP